MCNVQSVPQEHSSSTSFFDSLRGSTVVYIRRGQGFQLGRGGVVYEDE